MRQPSAPAWGAMQCINDDGVLWRGADVPCFYDGCKGKPAETIPGVSGGQSRRFEERPVAA